MAIRLVLEGEVVVDEIVEEEDRLMAWIDGQEFAIPNTAVVGILCEEEEEK